MEKALVKASRQQIQPVDFVDELIKWLVKEERIQAGGITDKSYRRIIGKFQDFLKDNTISEPDLDTVAMWVEMLKQTLKPKTINSYLIPVRLFFRFLDDTGVYSNKIYKKKLVKVKKTKGSKVHSREWVRPEWIQKMTYFMDDSLKRKRDKALMLTLFYSGLRTIEASRLTNGDIIFLDNKIQLKILGKGRSETEFVDTHPEAVQAITDYQAALRDHLNVKQLDDNEPLFISLSWNGKKEKKYFGQHLTTISISRIIKGYIKKLKLPQNLENKLCAHSLRHAFITVALLRGIDARIVQGWARHQDLNTTLGYAHDITADNLWNDYTKAFDSIDNLVGVENEQTETPVQTV